MKKVAINEDLRYLEQFISDEVQSTHPSDKLLADFIDQKLNESQKEEIKLHLIRCYECRDIIININDNITEKTKIANLILWSPLILLTASVVLFLSISKKELSLGMIDLSKPPSMIYQGATDSILIDKIINADEVLKTIMESTDLSHNIFLTQAIKGEKDKAFEEAKKLYKQALIQSIRNPNTIQRLKEKIIIHYHLLQVSYKTQKKVSIEEYKNIIRYEIRIYSLKYHKEEK